MQLSVRLEWEQVRPKWVDQGGDLAVWHQGRDLVRDVDALGPLLGGKRTRPIQAGSHQDMARSPGSPDLWVLTTLPQAGS